MRGRNPYTAFNLVDCLTRYGVPLDATTPLQVGAFAGVHYYPTHQQLVRVFAQVTGQLNFLSYGTTARAARLHGAGRRSAPVLRRTMGPHRRGTAVRPHQYPTT